jgi:hypothetical protein
MIDTIVPCGPAVTSVRALSWCGERPDDAGAQAAACALVAVVTPPNAIVGYRQSPTGAVDIVSHHDLTLVTRGERMLKGVDHELGGNEPEAHRLAGFHGAGHGLHEERMRLV